MLLLRMPSLPIIYASTSGNVLAVCERISSILQGAGVANTLHRVEITPISVLQESPTLVFATSTWEHGVLNPYFNTFFKEMETVDCTGKQAAFVGLGDTRYEPVMFCKGMEKVKERFTAQGGTEIVPALRINGEPYPYLETTVTEWAGHLAEKLTKLSKPAKPLNTANSLNILNN